MQLVTSGCETSDVFNELSVGIVCFFTDVKKVLLRILQGSNLLKCLVKILA